MADITRRRTGELLRKLFEILIGAPEGLQARVALEKLADSVQLTDYESGVYESTGGRRFEKIVRFATVDCVKAGWLLKEKGTWTITDEGRKAYEAHPDPELFYREAVRLYNIWRKGHEGRTQGQSDPLTEIEDDAEKSSSITYEQAEEQAWREIESHISSMDPYEFQRLVADLLRAMGYYPSWVAPPGKDGGLDIIAHPDPLGTREPRIKVQVKRQQDRINRDGISSFLAHINADVGLFVCIGGFTRDAEDFARMQERRKITLLNLEQLVDLWIEFYPKLDDLARERLPLTPIYFLTPKT
jgi:restriction system protein